MFCPNCKAEYREGFTECSECGIPLVKNLMNASVSTNGPENLEAAELLWTGTDSSASGAITEVLDAAKISYRTTLREVGALPGLEKPVYAILIHARDAEAANAALDEARLGFESPQENPSGAAAISELTLPDAAQQEDSDDSSSLDPQEYVPEDFDPKAATAEVWSGADLTLAKVLKDCLRENGIGCAVNNVQATNHLAVRPSDLARAREIIREVVEATPPE
jgi:hypothetical protein